MSTQVSDFFNQQLPDPLYQQLLCYQQRRGHENLGSAVQELLTNALLADTLSTVSSSPIGDGSLPVDEPNLGTSDETTAVLALPLELAQDPSESAAEPLSSIPDERISQLEQRLNSLTQELRQLRRESPGQLDRLREQVAAVRLSHSGLIQDLSRRLEAIESATFAPFHLQPDAIGLGSPIRKDALNITHPELLVAHGPIPKDILSGKVLANGALLNGSTVNDASTSERYTPESSAD
jgi:hypothetical protein